MAAASTGKLALAALALSQRKKQADVDPPKKVKVPKAFIVRPHECANANLASVVLQPETMDALNLKNNQFVYLSKSDSGGSGLVVSVTGSSIVSLANLVLVSLNIRSLAGWVQGDRLQVVPSASQPNYALSIEISVFENNALVEEWPQDLELSLHLLLSEIGVIYPGLCIVLDKYLCRIIDVNTDLATGLSNLSINSNGAKKRPASLPLPSIDPTPVVSPAYIFQAGTITPSPLSECVRSKYPHLQLPASYSLVGGLSKQIALLKSTIDLPLHQPTLFSDFGIDPPRGVLLHGPPGTGKSMLLRCIAHETNAHVLTVNGPSIVSKYLGETENAIRELFIEARTYAPSIIFLDEIDSLAPSRSLEDSGETELRVVATLLTMMDGLSDAGRVLIVGATNRPNSIDPALRRPGRFDQEIEIGIPDVDGRNQILTAQFARMNAEKCDLTLDDIATVAARTHGYVGADLAALCRELVMKAIQRGRASGNLEIKLTLQDVDDAISEIRPSAMRQVFLEMPKVYWSDIGGQHELKQKLMEVVQLPLECALAFSSLGVLAPKGVLLYGPPGCSKTLTAKALATESGLNFFAVKGPEIFNKYVGELERTVREIFRKARAALPSIIFFDEIDAILGDRDLANTLAALHVLTSLLNEIDGVEELRGVVVVAATNRPTEIDPALLRPGRLDRHIYVSPPDCDARLQILRNGCKKFKLDESGVDLQALAEITRGCSGAEVALLCQEAGLAAIMENKEAAMVHQRHFDHAVSGISRGITDEMIAYYKEFASRSGLSI